MVSVEVDEKVKSRLEEYKKDQGCKSLSDAINLLLFERKMLKDKINHNY